MRKLYDLINARASTYIPDDIPFKEAFPDYTDWCVIWYREAESLRAEFAQEGLMETAHAVADIIQDNLSSAWHDKDRHIILNKLTHDYKLAIDTLLKDAYK